MIMANVLALPVFSTEFAPSWFLDPYVVIVWLCFLGGGFITGFLIPRYWYASLATAWYPLLFGLTAPFGNCNPEPIPYYCINTVHLSWVAPALAVFAGYLGARVKRRRSSKN